MRQMAGGRAAQIRRVAFAAGLVCATLLAPRVYAQPAENATIAREAYVRGSELAKAERWGEALAAFEQSNEARPHALTLYNLGVCERVLGLGTRARGRFRDTLLRAGAHPGELAAALVENSNAYLGEYARSLVRVEITIAPKEAAIAIDGRPLRVVSTQPELVLEANTSAPGLPAAAPAETFTVELDPGPHVLTLARQGFADVAVRRTFASGFRGKLTLAMDRLPASVQVLANVPGAVVRVDGVDVGLAPVDLSRPPGQYRVEVSKIGYLPYRNDMRLAPGADLKLRAELSEEKVPITKTWWFWTGAAAIVAGGALITYAATRPTPEPPPYDAGTTGWLAGTR